MNFYNKKDLQNIKTQKFSFVKFEQSNYVLKIILNRPKKKNALHPQMINELAFLFQYAADENKVRSILIKSVGDVFCAGMDLSALSGKIEKCDSTIPKPKSKIIIGELFNKLHKPKICQIEGDVYAGGILIVSGCNYVIANKNVSFGLPEVKRGIFPLQVMESLTKIMPFKKLMDWCIRGYNLDAEKAFELGLVDQLAEKNKIEKSVNSWLDQVNLNSPTAIKFGIKTAHEVNSNKSNHKFLSKMLNKLLDTKDAKEGIQAFIEKRKPNWD